MNASGVRKQASQVWYKHLQVLTSIVQRVAKQTCTKCSGEYNVTELEQASQGYVKQEHHQHKLELLDIKQKLLA